MTKQTTKYKQTEIGWIPEDWEVKELGDVVVLRKEKFNPILSKNIFQCVELESIEPKSGRIIGQIFTNSVVSLKSKFYKNDILFGKLRPYLRKYANPNFSGVCTTEIWVLNSQNNDNKFLFYVFQSDRIIEIANQSTGTKMPRAEWSIVSKTQIPLPPLAEQQAIAAALSDCDAWIDSQEKRLAKKRLIKQGAMQQLLGFDSAQPASAVERSRNWEVKKLGEVCDVIGGGTPSTFNSDFWNGKINWFTPTEVGNSKYLFESNRKISTSGLKNSSATILPINTILLTTRAGIGDLGILKIEACTNQGFQSLICKENADYQFIYYLMQTQKNVLLNNASGSTFLEISSNKLKSIEIKMPSLAEQTRIATILSDMDAEITAMENELAKSRQIKQGMMQELLTGRRRLPAASAEVQTGHAPSLHKNQIHKNQIDKNQIDKIQIDKIQIHKNQID